MKSDLLIKDKILQNILHKIKASNAPGFILAIFLSVLLGCAILYIASSSHKWIFVLVLLAVAPFIVIKIGSVRKAFMALLVFSFSMNLDFNPWYHNTNIGMPISLTAIALLGLYILWLSEIMSRHSKVNFYPSITIPCAILSLWAGLSFVVSVKPAYTFYYFIYALEFFLTYFYIINFLKTRTEADFIVKIIAITVIFSAFIGICQYVFPGLFNFQFMGWENDPLKLKDVRDTISRAEGFLGHANNLAFFLVMWLPLLFMYAVKPCLLRLRIFYLSAFSIGVLALILTFSRGGWLAFAFSSLLIFISFFNKRTREKLPALGKFIGASALIVIILMSPFYGKIYQRLTRDMYGAAHVRIPLARAALRVIEQKPFTGTGLGNYQFVAPRLLFTREAAPVHNIYLHMAAELGIPALVLFLWLLLLFLRQGIIALKTSDRMIFPFALGLMIGLSAICLHGMFELGNIGSSKLLPVSFIGGLLVALGQHHKRIDAEENPCNGDAT